MINRDGGSCFLLQILHQVQNLGLMVNVQRRGRLIRYEDFRLAHQRHGYHDSLGWPPESWKDIPSSCALHPGNTCQLQHLSTALSQASCLLMLLCIRIHSVIWSPIFGDRVQAGHCSWKIMEIFSRASSCAPHHQLLSNRGLQTRIPFRHLPVVPIQKSQTDRAVTLFARLILPRFQGLCPLSSISTPSTDLITPLSV